MSVTRKVNGSLTTSASEQALATITDPGVYILNVDTSLLADGDEILVKVYVKTLSGSTETLRYQTAIRHAQSEPEKTWPPVMIVEYVRFTIQRLAGTDRTLPWSVMTP
jgi:hypothetical protein